MAVWPYFVFVIFLSCVSSKSLPKVSHRALDQNPASMQKFHDGPIDDNEESEAGNGLRVSQKVSNYEHFTDEKEGPLSARLKSRRLLEMDEPGEESLEDVLKSITDKNNKTEKFGRSGEMDDDDILKTSQFHNKVTKNLAQDSLNNQGSGEESIIGTASDYVLIAMIVAMMFCMTLCCLCLFCRSSSRLSICGINFELNDRRNSLNAAEDLSEIHEVVPLTPTTAGEYNNRLPDIESMLRADAPPPLYNEICKEAEKQRMERKTAVTLQDEVKRTEATTQEQQAKENEAKAPSRKHSRKKPRLHTQTSYTSDTSSTNGRSSWKIPGRGILASFRARSSMLRRQRSDSGVQRQTTVVESLSVPPSNRSDGTTPTSIPEAIPEEGGACRRDDDVAADTVNEVDVEARDNSKEQNKVFVYDINELPDADDDVFM